MRSRAPRSADDYLSGLAGQRVLVTAGAGGIGLAIAETLGRLGARLVVCDVSDAALAAVGNTAAVEAAVRRMCSARLTLTGCSRGDRDTRGLDALINNAGSLVQPGRRRNRSRRLAPLYRRLPNGPIPRVRGAPCRCSQAAGGGSIVSMSSAAGRHGYAFRTPYSAARVWCRRLSPKASPRNSDRVVSA
ncbi:SDR family NAD(P)-dependent oxidoreductase [Mesorhizobium atlanticum]